MSKDNIHIFFFLSFSRFKFVYVQILRIIYLFIFTLKKETMKFYQKNHITKNIQLMIYIELKVVQFLIQNL